MPFGVVNRVIRWIGVLDGVHVPQGEGEVWGCFRSHWFESCVLTKMYSTRAWKVDSISVRTVCHYKRLFIGYLEEQSGLRSKLRLTRNL